MKKPRRFVPAILISVLLSIVIAWPAAADTSHIIRLSNDVLKKLSHGAKLSPLNISPQKTYKEGEILVKLRPYTNVASKFSSAILISMKEGRGLYKVRLEPGETVENKVKELSSDPDVEYAQPDYIYHKMDTVPNDTYFPDQWGMLNTGQKIGGIVGKPGADMKMTDAWGTDTGSTSVVAAIIDTGVDYYHPDLVNNLWANPDNGKPVTIADINDGVTITGTEGPFGFRCISSIGSPNVYDDNGHGTHVAGIIGAEGNNPTGVAGMDWNVSLMILKGLDATGAGYDSDLIACIDYIVAKKTKENINVVAINASWGAAGQPDPALQDAVQSVSDSGILFIAAAGNGKNDTGHGVDDDIPGNATLPANFGGPPYNIPGVISVAATDNTDKRASFSNYGTKTVHVAAPGNNIISTIPTRQNIFFDNFESGMGNWTTSFFSDSSVQTPWAITTESYFSPTHSITDSPGAKYKAGTDTYIYAGPFDLSGYSNSPGTISLDYEAAFAFANTKDDGVYIFVSKDGVNWGDGVNVGLEYSLDGYGGTTDGAYTYLNTDISVLGGIKTAYVMFNLYADPKSPGADGVHLDDVGISLAPTSVQTTGRYGYKSGTSMATPAVTGLAALLASVNPDLTGLDIKNIILSSVDPLGLPVISRGRINGARAVGLAKGNNIIDLTVTQNGGYSVITGAIVTSGLPWPDKRITFIKPSVTGGKPTIIGSAKTNSSGVATIKPPAALGTYSITASSGQFTSNSVSYTIYPPAISGITPAIASPGTPVTVTGSWFGSLRGKVYLKSGTKLIRVTVTKWTDNDLPGGASVTFTVPRVAQGTYSVAVLNRLVATATAAWTSGLTISMPVISAIKWNLVSGGPMTANGPGALITAGGSYFGSHIGRIMLSVTNGKYDHHICNAENVVGYCDNILSAQDSLKLIT